MDPLALLSAAFLESSWVCYRKYYSSPLISLCSSFYLSLLKLMILWHLIHFIFFSPSLSIINPAPQIALCLSIFLNHLPCYYTFFLLFLQPLIFFYFSSSFFYTQTMFLVKKKKKNKRKKFNSELPISIDTFLSAYCNIFHSLPLEGCFLSSVVSYLPKNNDQLNITIFNVSVAEK